MYIIAIAWIYVTLLMSLTERSFVAGAATFMFYGVFPLAILLWLLDTPARRRRRRDAPSASSGDSGAGRSSRVDPDD